MTHKNSQIWRAGFALALAGLSTAEAQAQAQAQIQVEVNGDVQIQGDLQVRGNGGNVKVQVNGADVDVAQPGAAKPEKEKPKVSPEVEKSLYAFFEKLKTKKRKIWAEKMEKEVAAMIEATEMTANQKKALDAAVEKTLDACVDEWLELVGAQFRQIAEQQPRIINQMLAQANNSIDRYVDDDMTSSTVDPSEHKLWTEAWTAQLNAEQKAKWSKAVEQRKALADEEFKKDMKPFEDRAREEFNKQITARAGELKDALQLPPDRAQQLDELGKKAVEVSMQSWHKRLNDMAQQLTGQRRRWLQQGRMQVGTDSSEGPDMQPAWKDGVAKLLSTEEKKKLADEASLHKTRRAQVMARLFLVFMDEKVALTSTQREKLMPLAEKIIRKQASLFPDGRQENYVSLNAQTFLNAGSETKKEDVKDILDDAQWSHWQAASKQQNNQQQERMAAMQKAAASPNTPVDPEVLEQTVSEYLASKASRQRATILNTYLLQAEDAARVAAVTPDSQGRLQIAARGATEKELQPWKMQVTQMVRSNLQLNEVTMQTLRQHLAGMGDYGAYRNPNEKKQEQPIWKKALDTELTPAQRAAWQKEIEERKKFRERTIVATVVAELDRVVPLRTEQWEQAEAKVTRIITEYQEEIPRYFSFGDGGAWYLQSYTRMMPLAGIPEAEMKELLGKAQWERWSTTNEFINASNYWTNIKQMHDNRRR